MTSETAKKVSIMIPSYNRGDYIEKAIESALAQDYPNLEVFVADNGSSDRTLKIIEKFKGYSNFIFFKNSKNLGRVGNYQKCLYDYATGEWVLNLDADDFLENRKFISLAINTLQHHPNAVLYVGGQKYLETDGKYIERKPTKALFKILDGKDFFLTWKMLNVPVPHLASIYHRDTAIRTGLYKHDILSADWESLRRLCLKGDVILTNRIAGVWRGHYNNDSKNFQPEEHLKNLNNIIFPYEEAKGTDIDRARLEKWKNQALTEYLVYYFLASLGAGRMDFFKLFFSEMQSRFPKIKNLFYQKFISNPKLTGKLIIYSLGGKHILGTLRKWWRTLLLPSQ